MKVAVNQPGQERAPAGVDYLRARATQGGGFGRAAHKDYLITAYGDGFGMGIGRVDGVDSGVYEQIVSRTGGRTGRSRHKTLNQGANCGQLGCNYAEIPPDVNPAGESGYYRLCTIAIGLPEGVVTLILDRKQLTCRTT